MKRKVLGLRLSFTQYRPSKDDPRIYLRATVRIAKGFPSKTFVTNTRIREELDHTFQPNGATLGEITLAYNPQLKLREHRAIYPFLKSLNMQGKGFGKLLEYRVVQEFNQRFPEARTVTFVSVQTRGREYLKRLGLTEGQIEYGLAR